MMPDRSVWRALSRRCYWQTYVPRQYVIHTAYGGAWAVVIATR